MTALVIGSSGVLGSTISRHLCQDLGMKVIGADVVEMPNTFKSSDWNLHGFISLPTIAQRPSVAEFTTELALGIHNILGDMVLEGDVDAIVCASGGWAGDPRPKAGKIFETEELLCTARAHGDRIERMMYMNLIPVIAASYCSQTFMGPDGLLVVIGATAALTPTPGMLGYGLTKAAAHHIVQTMGATSGNALDTRAKRKSGHISREFSANLSSLSVVGILPTTIDSPSNRQAMPDADFNNWTKPDDIAMEIGTWVKTPALRPHSGALVKVTSTGEGPIFDIIR